MSLILTADDLRTPYVLREWPDGRALAWGSSHAAEACKALGFNVLVLTASGCQFIEHDFGEGVEVVRLPYEDDGAAMADERLKARIVEVAKRLAWRLRPLRLPPARVLVTCAMGFNRSALVAARVLHEATGIPGFLCAHEIRKVRPGALSRQAFREWAESWEAL